MTEPIEYATATYRSKGTVREVAVLCDVCRSPIWHRLTREGMLDRPAVPEKCVDCALEERIVAGRKK